MRVWLSQSCPVGRPWPSYTDTVPSVLPPTTTRTRVKDTCQLFTRTVPSVPPTTTRTRVSLSVRVGVSADHRWLSQSCPVGRPWPSYTDTVPSVLPPTTTRTRVSLSVRVGVSADHRWLSQSCPVGRPWPSYTDTVPSVLPPTTTRTRVSLSVRVGV